MIAMLFAPIRKALAWLGHYGIKIEAVPIPFQTVQPRFSPSGGGLAMIEALAGRIGAAALPVALDVTDEASIAAAYDAAEAQFGTVDTVIANAGQSNAGRATDVPADELRSTIDVNFTGVLLTAREGARRLMAARCSWRRIRSSSIRISARSPTIR